jgi:membrane protein YqaA with SNARE-associated domain
MSLEYLGLFLSAFLSATLLPGSSEILLVSLMQQDLSQILLWLWATSGNSLGSIVNWVLGRYFLHFQHKRWFPVNEQSLEKAQHWFQRYGIWSLLLSWTPVIGDPLTLLAGVMKVRLSLFILLVVIAKGARYALLLGVVNGFS